LTFLDFFGNFLDLRGGFPTGERKRSRYRSTIEEEGKAFSYLRGKIPHRIRKGKPTLGP